MRDLERESGLPRTAIHFHLAQGVLPPPVKAARNSAVYSDEHLARLRAIGRLKMEGVDLPVPLLRRAAELIDRGVEPDVALEFERAVAVGRPVEGSERADPMSLPELAREARVPQDYVRKLAEAGVLVPLPGAAGSRDYDVTDVGLGRDLYALSKEPGLDPSMAKPISGGFRRAA